MSIHDLYLSCYSPRNILPLIINKSNLKSSTIYLKRKFYLPLIMWPATSDSLLLNFKFRCKKISLMTNFPNFLSLQLPVR